jgi:hypothetical protein
MTEYVYCGKIIEKFDNKITHYKNDIVDLHNKIYVILKILTEQDKIIVYLGDE